MTIVLIFVLVFTYDHNIMKGVLYPYLLSNMDIVSSYNRQSKGKNHKLNTFLKSLHFSIEESLDCTLCVSCKLHRASEATSASALLAKAEGFAGMSYVFS